MSLETISIESISNKSIQQIGNARINIPSNFQLNLTNMSSISLRVSSLWDILSMRALYTFIFKSIMQPLASFGNSSSQSNTNLSRSISFTLLDHDGNEISMPTSFQHPIEFIIPRDSNLIIPPMNLQNVTSFNSIPHNQLFNLHYINITSNLPISIHFEMNTLNISLGYLLIYKYDTTPLLNSSINQIDSWILFCPINLTTDGIYTFFIDNQQTINHKSIIIGIRELNSTEFINFCSNSSINSPPITDQQFSFTSNYELRIYTSGCYYLDSNNNWQSDGLVVIFFFKILS